MCAGQIRTASGDSRTRTAGRQRAGGQDRKILVTFIEIDPRRDRRDSSGDWLQAGQARAEISRLREVAATFCDLQNAAGRPRRGTGIVEGEGQELCPEIADKNQQQMEADPDDARGGVVRASVGARRAGSGGVSRIQRERRVCAECGEGINFERHVEREGQTLCRSCAGEPDHTAAVIRYAITNGNAALDEEKWMAGVARCLGRGVDFLQIRERDLGGRRLAEITRRVLGLRIAIRRTKRRQK